MKKLSIFYFVAFYLSVSRLCPGQTASGAQAGNRPSSTPYTVVSRDANSQIWEKTTYESSQSGSVIPHKHHVTELATGLNYWDGKQWSPSISNFQISDDGQWVFATNLQHRVRLAANLNAESSVSITTPDGIVLHTTPVAIGLFDENTSNSVIIGAITNCSGILINSNQVVYENAFDGVAADIVYTLKRGSFSQDIVLKQDVDPADYGCSSNSVIRIFTEFYRTPQPKTDKNKLHFGKLSFQQGWAYTAASTNQTGGVPVNKDFTTISGRTFLIESVKYNSLQRELRALPQNGAAQISKTKITKMIKNRYATIPSPHATAKVTVLIRRVLPQIAEIDERKGVVMDYEVVDDTFPDPMVFQGDTTYFIGDELDGLNAILEGGTVIKFYAELKCSITCNTGPYRPAIFTAVGDDSVGESMKDVPGSGYVAGTIGSSGQLLIQAGSVLENCRFCYAQNAVYFPTAWTPGQGVSFYDCQFLNCGTVFSFGLDVDDYALFANCLIANANTVATDSGSSESGNNVYCYDSTFDNCSSIFSYAGDALVAVNSIFSNSGFEGGSNYGSYNGFYNCGGTFGSPAFTDNNPPYQGVGGGNYYLADNTFRGVGTVNVDQSSQEAGLSNLGAGPNILWDLATKTTWSPTVYSNVVISTNLILVPTVPRDTNGLLYGYVDLGYHYDPLDYVFGGCDLYSNLTFTAGAAVGWFENSGASNIFGQPYSISLNNGANLSFQGSSTQPCFYTRSALVQEGGNGVWLNTNWLASMVINGSGSSSLPKLSADFTKWTEDNTAPFFCDDWRSGVGSFRNSEFYDAGIASYDTYSLNFTNCLFFRDCSTFWGDQTNNAATSLSFVNCTFFNGGLSMNRYSGALPTFWLVENSAFDGTALAWTDNYDGADTEFNYNAYNTNNFDWTNYSSLSAPVTNTLEVVGSKDVMTNDFDWQSSWLGNFYLPPGSPLIDAGSTNANLLGFYYFTTQTNQSLESNSIVDIGYHYVATDTYGTPLADGDWPLASQTVIVGGTVAFTVPLNMSCDGPSTYQWQHDGTNINDIVNIITTIAGNGSEGYSGDGGPALDATFGSVVGIAADSYGNLYVVDQGNNVVREISPNGIIATVAGNGMAGYSGDGGPAINASLNAPMGICVDNNGNLYIADLYNNAIRKVSADGTITTVAGNGTSGWQPDGGPATNSTLNYPEGVAVDGSGNLYIADTGNLVIWKVANGIISRIAGNGTMGYSGDGGLATNASFNNPVGIAVDAGNNIYISDSAVIRKVDTNGIITTIAGNGIAGYSGDGGVAIGATLSGNLGYIALDSAGNLYIADQGNNAIREINTSGIIWTVAGNGAGGYSGDGGPAINASLSSPAGIAVGSTTNFDIGDSGNNVIRQVSLVSVTNQCGTLILTNVTSSDAGIYQVIFSSPCGSVTSSVPTLTVLGAPIITAQPIGQIVETNDTATFTVMASGAPPLDYQWYFKGTNLNGATSSILTLNNVQTNDAGNYCVVVTNDFGAVTSFIAALTVITPPIISITNPINNEIIITSQTNVTLDAAASDSDGTVTQVQFFEGTTNIGTVSSTPYNLVWSNAPAGNYALTAVATDNYGLVSTSSVVNVFISPLFATNTMRLWLKADAIVGITNNGSVSNWLNSSGWSYFLGQSVPSQQPSYRTNGVNGYPVVYFNPTNEQLMAVPNFLTGATGVEAFVVLKVTSDPPSSTRGLWYYSADNVPGNESYPNTSGGMSDDFCSHTVASWGPPAQSLTQYHIFEETSQTNLWAAWINGVLQYHWTNNVPWFGPWFNLGNYGPYFDGDIAEVMIFSGGLTTGERQTINAYLSGKYGLVPEVPATPSNLAAIAVSSSQISLTWSEVINSGATQISIERSTATNGPFAVVGQVADSLSYIDTNLSAGTMYYYRVRAINITQWSPYSNEANVSTMTNAADLPLSNLALWLKGDSGLAPEGTNARVNYWPDQSGNGNGVGQTTGSQEPTWIPGALNGLPVVYFNPTNEQLLAVPNFLSGATGVEAFVVLKVTADPPSSTRGLWYYSPKNTPGDESYPSTTGSMSDDFCSTTIHSWGPPALPLTQYHIFEETSQTNLWAAWVNGILQYQSFNNAVGFGPWFNLGNYGPYFDGDIAEVMIFNRALTNSERTTVIGYLNGKYGLVPTVPTTPTNLVATAISPTQIELTWYEPMNSEANEVVIERSTSSGGPFTAITQLTNATSYSYVDTNLTPSTTYYYEAQAVNLAQGSPVSNEAEATTYTTGTNVPVGNLALWLMANSGLPQNATNTPVSFWFDQSGNGNNAQQSTSANRPIWVPGAINSLPVVQFNGTNSYLTFLTTFMNTATGGEAFVVLNVSVTNSEHPLWEMGGYGDGGQGDTEQEAYPYTDGSIRDGFGSKSRFNIGAPAQPLTQYHLFDVASQTNNWAAWINGVLLYQTTNSTVGFGNAPTLGVANNNGGGSDYNGYFDGNIAEILVFNRTLTTGERIAIYTYLNGKYAVISVPPAPTNLTARAISPTQIQLAWYEPLSGGATQIVIERSTSSSGPFTVVTQLTNTTLSSYVDTNLTPSTTYYYQAQAFNLTQESPISNEAGATTYGAGPNVPLGNLTLWLMANAGLPQNTTNTPASLWYDQSGNGNNAQQSTAADQPVWVPGTIDNLPAVHFNGTNAYLILPTSVNPSNAAEAFVVLRASSSNPTSAGGLWQFGSSAAGLNGGYPEPDGTIQDNFYGNNMYNLGVPAQPVTQFNVYEVSSQTGNWEAWINGIPQFITSNNVYTIQGYGSPTLGAFINWWGNSYFSGDIAEVLLFNRTLTASERQAVNAYLNGKYDFVPAVPPAPTNLVATAISPTQIGLMWSESLTNGGATQIAIERSTNSGGPFTTVAQVSDALSYVDTNLTAGTTYYYEVQAINLTQWSPPSNEAQATTLIVGADVPFANLALWLKADSGLAQTSTNVPINLWADESGNGNNAQQTAAVNQPVWVPGTIGNLPTVQFNGTNNYFNLQALANTTTGGEAFVVLKVSNSNSLHSLWYTGSYNYNIPDSQAYPDVNGDIRDSFGSININDIGIPSQPLTQYHVFEVSSQTNDWAAWVNGVLQFQTSNNTVGFPSAPALGASPYDGGSSVVNSYFAGNIAEVMIFNRPLVSDERDTVGNYLFSKYNLLQYASNAIAPNPVTNFYSTGIAPYQLGFQWTPTSTNVYSFHLERASGTNGVYQEVASSPQWITNLIDTTASPTNTYNYRVRAHNLFGDSYSATISPPTVALTNWPSIVLEYETNVVAAQAASAAGSISSVQFFQGLVNLRRFGMSTTAPYTANWVPTMEGAQSFAALATDNQGNSQFSGLVTVMSYLASNTNGIPNIISIQEGNDPMNPWITPTGDTNTSPPTINLTVPANATLVP